MAPERQMRQPSIHELSREELIFKIYALEKKVFSLSKLLRKTKKKHIYDDETTTESADETTAVDSAEDTAAEPAEETAADSAEEAAEESPESAEESAEETTTTEDSTEIKENDDEPKQAERRRELDFSRYNLRHILLKVCYLGWDYCGYAGIDMNIRTIERELFKALLITRLIKSIKDANYQKCGRTDKGVSAFEQVISLDVRTNLLKGKGVVVPQDSKARLRVTKTAGIEEINYCEKLNSVLPPEIRILAWAPVDQKFNARFYCQKRTYKYYFPRSDLNIEIMQEAGQQFVGKHDFRNFSKFDLKNARELNREILSVDITQLDKEQNGYQMFELTVVGRSFLWHMIRCIVAVLVEIGRGNEKPDIIAKLLDVEEYPFKPQYLTAFGIPLILFNTEYKDVTWETDPKTHSGNIKTFQEMWAVNNIRTVMLKQILTNLEESFYKGKDVSCERHQCNVITQDLKGNHVPFLNRHVNVSVYTIMGDSMTKGKKQKRKKQKVPSVENQASGKQSRG